MEKNSNVTVLAQSILENVQSFIADGAEHTVGEIYSDIISAALSAIGVLARIEGDDPQEIIPEVVKQTHEVICEES